MTFASLVLELKRADRGWTVAVLPFGSSFALDEVVVGGRPYPVVPPERLPPVGSEHRDLCSGDPQAVRDLIERITKRHATSQEARVYGMWLFECVLQPVWDLFVGREVFEPEEPVEISLKLPDGDPSLHGLLWETMHDGKNALVAHPDRLVAITRVVDAAATAPAIGGGHLRVVFASGSSLDDQTLRSGVMTMALLRGFEMNGLCTPYVQYDTRVAELRSEINRVQPHVVHLAVRGGNSRDGWLFEMGKKKNGESEVVEAQPIRDAICPGKFCPALVVISAMQDEGLAAVDHTMSLGPSLVGKGVPVVIAMNGDISETASRLYVRRLMYAVQNGKPLVEAAAHGRRSILVDSELSGTLDWAMPVLYRSTSLPDDFRLVDQASHDRVMALAEHLELRQMPVFFGRLSTLSVVDSVLDPTGRCETGFVALWRDGDLSKLGCTRLLQEMAFRFLRGGHVPLLLGPYGPNGGPSDLRQFIVELLHRSLDFAEALHLRPAPATTLASDIEFAQADKVTNEGLAKVSYAAGYAQLRAALKEFAESVDIKLDPRYVRTTLRSDISNLAAIASKAGPPFGAHTRVVILGDNAHTWLSALDDLLFLATRNGLGTPEHPIPIILAASRLDKGMALKNYIETHDTTPGFRFPEIATLPADEALFGYLTVLLHPFRSARDPVYAAKAIGNNDRVRRFLAKLEGYPAAVKDELFVLAGLLADDGELIEHDDDSVFVMYEKQQARYL